MKFIDLLKEPSEEKLLQKAKAVFSALRKGKISRDNGSQVFTYELGNRTFARVKDGEVEVVGSVISIKKLTFCPLNERFMTELIENRFKTMFDINVELRPPTKDQVEEYTGKMPWEEPLNEEIDIDKERKRVKTIHKSLRKGIVNLSDGKYRYELPEDYTFHVVDDVLTQTSIKFTFYNHDLGPSFGGVGLPLRVWRIEEGKDVFINGILSNADVSDIVYGDEYLINSNSGVDYINVKNKVKVRYHNFDINAIMTTPSDIIMVNESEEDNIKKQIKKARTIYKALRKGTIGGDDPEQPHFTYVLSDDFTVDINNAGILIFTNEVKIKQLNRSCDRYSNNYVMDLIRKRFEPFGITLSITSYYMDFKVEPWESPINEGAEVLNPESLTDKEIKKVKLVYNTFKKGHFVYDQLSMYGYKLPDDYYIYKDELGDVCVKLDNEDTQKLYMFSKILSHEIELQPHHTGLHGWIKDRIIKKFEGFNIKFIF